MEENRKHLFCVGVVTVGLVVTSIAVFGYAAWAELAAAIDKANCANYKYTITVGNTTSCTSEYHTSGKIIAWTDPEGFKHATVNWAIRDNIKVIK